MKFLYLDESGDLGFNFAKKRTSRFFVISLIISPDDRTPAKIIKKVFRNLLKVRQNLIFHSYRELPKTRIKLLQNLANSSLTFASIVLEKKDSAVNFTKSDIYLAMALQLLHEINLTKQDKFSLIAEKSTSKKSIDQNFISRILAEFPCATVKISRPHEDKGLQAADFVAHATWLKYENNEAAFYNVIKDKTRDALARIHTVPPDRGIYLSTENYTKPNSRSQVDSQQNLKNLANSSANRENSAKENRENISGAKNNSGHSARESRNPELGLEGTPSQNPKLREHSGAKRLTNPRKEKI